MLGSQEGYTMANTCTSDTFNSYFLGENCTSCTYLRSCAWNFHHSGTQKGLTVITNRQFIAADALESDKS